MKYFLNSSINSCIIAKGIMGIPKCMNMLSLVPKAVLKGWKYAATEISIISVEIENNMKVLDTP